MNNILVAFAYFLVIVSCAPVNLFGRSTPTPPSQDPFYTAPDGYEDLPVGTILQYRQLDSPIGFLVLAEKLKAFYQIMYVSSDSNGNPEAAVTSILVPQNGDFTKLLSYQIAQDSAYINCAPSYAIQLGSNIDNVISEAEVLLIQAALNQGWIVNVPDYEGPKSAFTAGIQAAHATLDSIRAVLSSNGITGVDTNANVALWGYSGGSIASSWATLLQPTYAPELAIQGTAVGGFVVDIESTFLNINGGLFAGFVFPALGGLSREYPELAQFISEQLISSKQSQFNESLELCVIQEIAEYANQNIFDYVKDGSQVIQNPILQNVFQINNMTTKYSPNAPFFIYQAVNDEIAPVESVEIFVNDFCAQGANIQFNKDLTGEHATESIAGAPDALMWLQNRLDGVAVKPGCTVNTELSNTFNVQAIEAFGVEIADLLFQLLGKTVGPII